YDQSYLLSRVSYLLSNRELHKSQKVRMGIEIYLGGQKHLITCERQQIVDLLISIYEESVRINDELKVQKEELSHSHQILSGLYRIALGLNGAMGEQEVADKALERAMELPNVQAGWIVLHTGGGHFRVAAARGLPPALETSTALEGDCLCRRKFLSGELDHATNIFECERLQDTKDGTCSLRYHASIPLWIGSRRLGIMNLASAKEGLFSQEDLKTLYGVGNQLAVALERAQLYQGLEQKVEEQTIALRESERWFRAIFTSQMDAVVVVSPDRRIIDANAAAERMLGYSIDEMKGQSTELLSVDHEHYLRFGKYIREAFTNGKVARFEFKTKRKNGDIFPTEHTLSFLRNDQGELIGIVGVIRDITERKRAEEDIKYMAYHDLLTGLPNRTLLYDRLQEIIADRQAKPSPLALLLMDVDRFKEINDTLGHQWGDHCLYQVGQRLRRVVWEPDLVARLGGDEFAVLLPRLARSDDIHIVVQKILTALEDPLVVEGLSIVVEPSIGIALYPDHGADAYTLIRHADVAMYAAKEAGSGYILYEDRYNLHSPIKLALMGELRQAIERDQLMLHYQPKIDLRTRCVVGMEALIRWKHPAHGYIPPDQFIIPAEGSGLIWPLTQWILNTALRQCDAWHGAGLEMPVAVNLSRRSLQDTQLPDLIAQLLSTHKVAPSLLELEITESAIMADPVRAAEILTRLNKIGVQISIDDFGTGYSSLASLKRLPVNTLKIDKSFVIGMATSQSDEVIVRSTIDLAHNLGLKVIAEGVENQALWDKLSALNCDEAQGYYMSRPLPAPEMARWLKEFPYQT
ncbi:MAG: EAL domain-containing protein, partial [Nitrospira sp.]|nr:EAL domain-containing protein [Nitrospira sp.]